MITHACVAHMHGWMMMDACHGLMDGWTDGQADGYVVPLVIPTCIHAYVIIYHHMYKHVHVYMYVCTSNGVGVTCINTCHRIIRTYTYMYTYIMHLDACVYASLPTSVWQSIFERRQQQQQQL